jgi:hypothetical protein
MNALGGTGLWDEEDGFYYDVLHVDGEERRLKVRSLVGLLPLIACTVIEEDLLARLPGFTRRLSWFLENRPELGRSIACMMPRHGPEGHVHRLLAVPTTERLRRILRYLLDEEEFLSPYGIRSVSRHHRDHPYVLEADGMTHRVDYAPGESTTALFGGNSNWRGPIWFPINYLIVEALERYHHFYGDEVRVEHPTGSGRIRDLGEVAQDLWARLGAIFLPGVDGRRPCHGGELRYAESPEWRDLVLFYEYFHGDDGQGLGASHQTGWTALVIKCLEACGDRRSEAI